jgi:hypothetical protein
MSLTILETWSVVLSGYSGSFTTKTGRHDIAEILLKVALNTKNQSNQSIAFCFILDIFGFKRSLFLTVTFLLQLSYIKLLSFYFQLLRFSHLFIISLPDLTEHITEKYRFHKLLVNLLNLLMRKSQYYENCI